MKAGYEFWKDKTINCLGDSITFGAGNDGCSWVDYLGELLPEANIRKYGVCGSTLSLFQERDDAFVQRFRQMEMDYDLCIIYGGVNDFNHSLPLGKLGDTEADSFYGALELLIRTLLAARPEGELMFITPMKTRDFKGYPHWDTENADGHRLVDYRDAVLAVCQKYSIPVLDFFSMSGITADVPEMKVCIQPDGLHPNQAGYQQMTRKIYQFITNVM